MLIHRLPSYDDTNNCDDSLSLLLLIELYFNFGSLDHFFSHKLNRVDNQRNDKICIKSSYSFEVFFDFGLWSGANEFSKTNAENIIKPAIPVFSDSGVENRGILYFQIQSLLIFVLISVLENVRILVKYLFTVLLACLLNIHRLQLARLYALVVFVVELEVDFHSLLALGGVDGADL